MLVPFGQICNYTVSTLWSGLGQEKHNLYLSNYKLFCFPGIKLFYVLQLTKLSACPSRCCSLKGRSHLRTSGGDMTQNCKFVAYSRRWEGKVRVFWSTPALLLCSMCDTLLCGLSTVSDSGQCESPSQSTRDGWMDLMHRGTQSVWFIPYSLPSLFKLCMKV